MDHLSRPDTNFVPVGSQQKAVTAWATKVYVS